MLRVAAVSRQDVSFCWHLVGPVRLDAQAADALIDFADEVKNTCQRRSWILSFPRMSSWPWCACWSKTCVSGVVFVCVLYIRCLCAGPTSNQSLQPSCIPKPSVVVVSLSQPRERRRVAREEMLSALLAQFTPLLTQAEAAFHASMTELGAASAQAGALKNNATAAPVMEAARQCSVRAKVGLLQRRLEYLRCLRLQVVKLQHKMCTQYVCVCVCGACLRGVCVSAPDNCVRMRERISDRMLLFVVCFFFQGRR